MYSLKTKVPPDCTVLNLNLVWDLFSIIIFKGYSQPSPAHFPVCWVTEMLEYQGKKSSSIFKSTADVMLIKQAGSPDNKQTINLAVNLAQSILHAHYCHGNIISPVLNCLISCLSSYVNLLLAQRSYSPYSVALGLPFSS